jgi:hypothetical protein
MEPAMSTRPPQVPSTPTAKVDIDGELDHILNLLVVPWDTSDLPPNIRVMSPSLKIVEAKQAILALVAEEVRKGQIEPFDFVKPCEPNCSPERHAYHQAQWDMARLIKRHYGLGEWPGSEAQDNPRKEASHEQ